jgi:hypothetical protein
VLPARIGRQRDPTRLVEAGGGAFLAFQLQDHALDVAILGVPGKATQALLRIAPLHYLD